MAACWSAVGLWSSGLRNRRFLLMSWLSFMRRLAPKEAGINMAISVREMVRKGFGVEE